MIKHDGNFTSRKCRELTVGLVLVRLRPVVAAILLGASIFSTNTFAHNIDLDKSWELAREYARLVRKQSNGRYLHYNTNCVNAFPGHNHIVRCAVAYQDAKDTKAGVYTCKERVEFHLWAHSRAKQLNYVIYGRHTSNNSCGQIRLERIGMDAYESGHPFGG